MSKFNLWRKRVLEYLLGYDGTDYECTACGSRSLSFEGNLNWDRDVQDFEESCVFDSPAICDECSEEIYQHEAEVDYRVPGLLTRVKVWLRSCTL